MALSTKMKVHHVFKVLPVCVCFTDKFNKEDEYVQRILIKLEPINLMVFEVHPNEAVTNAEEKSGLIQCVKNYRSGDPHSIVSSAN